MSLIDWYCGPVLIPRRVRVRVACAYRPGSGLEPTCVEFTPTAELGSTPDRVHAEILRRLMTSDDFELPAIGVRTAFPFSGDTVRAIAVW